MKHYIANGRTIILANVKAIGPTHLRGGAFHNVKRDGETNERMDIRKNIYSNTHVRHN
jgi:hypothetical protein